MGMTDKDNLLRITKRSTDLHKIDEVNRVSREIANAKLDPENAIRELEEINQKDLTYPVRVQITAAGIVSGSFAIMFGGTWPDFLPALIAGSIGYGSMLWFNNFLEIRFLSEFFGSFLLAVASYLFIQNGFGDSLDKVIIGAVMPLVPGLPITNAIRDLMLGHFVAGLSKGIETVLTSLAIGAGVAILFAFV